MLLANARKLEDANLKLAEEKEAAALDAADPDRAEKEKAVRARYAQRRGELSAGRSEEDIANDAMRRQEQIAVKKRELAQTAELQREAEATFRDRSARAQAAREKTGLGSWRTGRNQMYTDMAERHSGVAHGAAEQALKLGESADRLTREIKQLEDELKIVRSGKGAAKVEAQASAIVSNRAVSEADTGVRMKEAKRREAQEAAEEAERLRKRQAAVERDHAAAQSRTRDAQFGLDAFDADPRNANTTNRTARDQRRAPLKEAVEKAAAEEANLFNALKVMTEANSGAMRALERTASAATREAEQIERRQRAGMVDAAGG
ncbi:MAG: hypothetical protein FWG50_13405 [Kiritimatiellaeota bacterium]|nr:hypothetical protein [Kiritimatiellota bacterium]